MPSQLFLFRVFGVVPKRCLPNCSFSGYPGGGTQAGARSAGTSPPQLQVGSSQYPTASVAPRRWVRGVSGGPFGSVRPEVIAFWVFRHFGQRLISARDPSCSAVSGLLLKLRSGTLGDSMMGVWHSVNNCFLGSLNAAESCVRFRLWLLSWHFASSEAATGISCGSSLWGSPYGGLQHSVAKLFVKPPPGV